MKSYRMTKCTAIHPVGKLTVCSPVSSCWDILLSVTNLNLKRGKVRGSAKAVGFIRSESNFMAIHPIVVEIFQFGQKW